MTLTMQIPSGWEVQALGYTLKVVDWVSASQVDDLFMRLEDAERRLDEQSNEIGRLLDERWAAQHQDESLLPDLNKSPEEIESLEGGRCFQWCPKEHMM